MKPRPQLPFPEDDPCMEMLPWGITIDAQALLSYLFGPDAKERGLNSLFLQSAGRALDELIAAECIEQRGDELWATDHGRFVITAWETARSLDEAARMIASRPLEEEMRQLEAERHRIHEDMYRAQQEFGDAPKTGARVRVPIAEGRPS